MKFKILPALLALSLFITPSISAPAAVAESNESEGAAILEKYFAGDKQSKEALRGMTMSVEMHASIPRLSREGGMKATRSVSPSGQITYTGMVFDGHDSIKRDVIARYMQAEVEAAKQPLGITQANYKFKYWGIYGSGEWQLHLFEVTPRKKAQGLFEGWLWIESKSNLPVREVGRFVKNPSVFLKRMEFVRDYDVRSGFARPMEITSKVLTRVVGEANVTIRFSNFEPIKPASAAVVRASANGN